MTNRDRDIVIKFSTSEVCKWLTKRKDIRISRKNLEERKNQAKGLVDLIYFLDNACLGVMFTYPAAKKEKEKLVLYF